MIYILSALAAVLPMLIYLFLIWRFDAYDHEPFILVLKNYLWGGIGAIFFTIIISGGLTSFFSFFIPDEEKIKLFGTLIIAPVVEEITKGIFLLITITNKKFDNITDGIVYGGAIGLGFGMTENFLYFIAHSGNFDQWLSIVFIRTFFSGVMHCLATATFGAFLGYIKFKGIYYKILFPLIGLGAAVFLHFSWNFTVSFDSTAALGFLLIFVSVIIFIIVFISSVNKEQKIIYNELIEEVNNGLIPYEHLTIVNSSKRNKNGWIDESIRKLYINAVTTLAFRKLHYRNSSGSSKVFYQNDIEYYRNFIQNLLINKN